MSSTRKGFHVNASRWALAALAFVLCGSVLLFAEEPKAETDAPAEAAAAKALGDSAAAAEEAAPAAAADPAVSAAQAAESDTKKQANKARLTKPWKDLSSLSEDQKTQIAAIHRKAVQEIKQIQQRERDAIMALLNDEQKTEIQTLTDKAAAERKTRQPAKAKNADEATDAASRAE